jgi:hypothetical protein
MAVDAVLGEPISVPIPCYQGNLQGISQNLLRILSRFYPNLAESMRLNSISVILNSENNRELF